MRYLFVIILLILRSFYGHSQEVPPPETIRSIQYGMYKNQTFVPFVPLNGVFHLEFDDLEADEKDYYYHIEHYDRNWKPSGLNTTEYITGYNEEKIYDFENSFNTLQDYTHYSLQIPNEYTRFKISGNYIISILNEEEEVVFTRRFMIYEPILTVGVSLHRSRDVSRLETDQSVHFIINYNNFRIDNPGEEIHPVIIQNYDSRNSVSGLQPQFIRPGQLIYKYDRETSFSGGNEFWNFDSKDIYNTNMSIARIAMEGNLYHAYLFLDRDRSFDTYTYYPDINGNYVIRNIKAENSGIEADYLWVHFSLETPDNFNDDVYVYGAFNNFFLNEENKMQYNPENGLYEKDILLKQGFYNYTYATKNNEGTPDLTRLNGSHEETENIYTVLVYYTKAGSYYDRIIGMGQGSSLKLQ